MKEFIDMIHRSPCLWDTQCREYRDMRKKDIAWQRIVKELECKHIPDIPTAKSEWKKLRDCHRDSMKRARASATAEDNIVNKWKYADMMAFLLPYMKSRKKRQSLSSDERETSASPSESFLVQPSTSNTDNFDSPIDRNGDIEETTHSDHEFRKRKLENDVGEVMIDIDDKFRYMEKGKSPLDLFFESMCETTKEFPTWLQYSVKRKIFNVISEAEDTFETYKSENSIFS